MKNILLPKWLFDEQDIQYITKNNNLNESKIKVNGITEDCIIFNSFTQFEQLIEKIYDNKLFERVDAQDRSFATRLSAQLFLNIREVSQIPDYNQRASAKSAILAAVATIYTIDPLFGRRLISVLRNI